MRPALAYRPGRSPIHRAPVWVAASFLGALALIAFLFDSPLVLVADGLAVGLAGLAAGARRALAASLRLAIPLLVLMTAVNALVSHRGGTLLIRGWDVPVIGTTDVTLEALAAGAAVGLRVVVVIMAFAVYSACVDPDRVLRALRPLARRSALTATLVVRLVPLAAADASRMREAAALRGPGAAPAGRTTLARRLVEGSLDRAIDVAATLELRGHSLEERTVPAPERSAQSAGLLLAALALSAVALAGLATGAGGFDPYPSLTMALDAPTLLLCAALPAIALAPVAGAGGASRAAARGRAAPAAGPVPSPGGPRG
ncbi:MAG TPA: energy-coupling factor transporter transmembrane component T [Solirubrobacterales bacterium]|nr:energy-coupling factor transporter transmembrane component T [Solirubrobacterales bacterium]